MSRFVSGGTDEQAIERDEAWLKAQEVIEAKHREKAEIGKQEGGKSLFETLQANKAAKQEQFEEALRLRNQFRSLDEDEAAFLDNVLESTRAREAEVKKETTEQLEAFRKRQEEAEKEAKQGTVLEDTSPLETSWSTAGRKRKKVRPEAIGGVKLRKTSSVDVDSEAPPVSKPAQTETPTKPAQVEVHSVAKDDRRASPHLPIQPHQVPQTATDKKPGTGTATRPGGLGLGAYSSDED